MKLSHTLRATSVAFDDPNLVSAGGLVPVLLLDIDDAIIEVHSHAKQGAGFGYSGVRGLNALLATLTTARSAPVTVAQRLREGSTRSRDGRSLWSATRSEPHGHCSARAR